MAVFPYAARSYTPLGPLQDNKHVWGVGWAEAVATLQVDAAIAETSIAFNDMRLTASLVLHCSPCECQLCNATRTTASRACRQKLCSMPAPCHYRIEPVPWGWALGSRFRSCPSHPPCYVAGDQGRLTSNGEPGPPPEWILLGLALPCLESFASRPRCRF